MLHDFITANRERIIELSRLRAGQQGTPELGESSGEHGVPMFLSQLGDALLKNREQDARLRGPPDTTVLTNTATLHGHDLLRSGFTLAQVVHGYGDVCQIVTELATHSNAAICADDFRVFNRCLDDAIAGAVTAYGQQRELDLAYEGTERLGVLVHEMRNLLNTAILSFEVIKSGEVGASGSTGAVHTRSLADLRSLIERSLTEVRLEAGVPRIERTSLLELLTEVGASSRMAVDGRDIDFSVGPVDGGVLVDVDRQLLSAALANLLQNAFKFSRAKGRVSLTVSVATDRVAIEVADECGGLALDNVESLFRPFARRRLEQSGLGLGLSIARRAVRINGGELRVRNVPGTGCVFSVDLPRASRSPESDYTTGAKTRQ